MRPDRMALINRDMGKYGRAEALLQQALAIEKIRGENHPGYAKSLNNLRTIYLNMGEYEKARQIHQKALEISKKVFG